jgi:hypothetical protein
MCSVPLGMLAMFTPLSIIVNLGILKKRSSTYDVSRVSRLPHSQHFELSADRGLFSRFFAFTINHLCTERDEACGIQTSQINNDQVEDFIYEVDFNHRVFAVAISKSINANISSSGEGSLSSCSSPVALEGKGTIVPCS